ncbi:hypothetical protein A2995_00065 [Candidatus Nomurabacteria bacterium RIFCSPLOWO2_01_FULL_33_24]|uniref:Type II secretion system protein GspF domain-containing protein n=1 Tax=Candidatus Nomurabacteria bacterium RIFCSPLOWO2_01_FULL_33_24 TaxID=1801765 RepID=A0A1F6X1X8_9BACT|nr:MAG: hypothetical protein A2995_00065 [Candidatus Nomurabacteria bacterium RIFCSPLOWO2_01_FULL_33_24]
MKFSYKAQDKKGEIIEGYLEADDKFSLANQLRGEGLTPISVEETKKKSKILFLIDKLDNLIGSVSVYEKITFTRNLGGMIQAGLSLRRSLDVLEKQTKNKKFKIIINSLCKDIDEGDSLSESLSKFPKVFSGLFVSMVKAGEESGSLAESLKEIRSNLEKVYKLNKRIKGALIYPIIVVSAVVITGILMFIYVVPTLTKVFKDLNVELPKTTKLVITLSDFLSENTTLAFLILIAFIIFITFLFKSKKTKIFIDFIILRLPMIGVIAKEVNSARTARTLSSLLSSGVDMTKALSITGNVLQNIYYKKILKNAEDSVKQGIPLSKSFKESGKLYPIMVGEMVEVGEETGNLAKMFLDIAIFYEEEVDNKTQNLSTIIEPVMMIIIGIAVGFFAVSMITPLYGVLEYM